MGIENKEKIRSRIKKLLNRAESNYSAEAESALLKAQQLMMEHGINKTDIEDEEIQTVVEKKAYHSQVSLWQGKVAWVIASNFRCKSIWNFECHAGKQKRVMTFIGFEEDAAIASEAYMYAISLVNRNIRKIRKRFPRVTIKYINTYKKGFLDGVSVKFNNQVNKNDWGLVLVTPAAVTEYYENLGCVPTKTIKLVESKNENAYQQGFLDGKSFKVYEEIKRGEAAGCI